MERENGVVGNGAHSVKTIVMRRPLQLVTYGRLSRHRLKAMYLSQYTGQFLRRLLRIVIRLQTQPEAARRAKESRKTQCRISRD